MVNLKLYGMKAGYDEIISIAVTRYARRSLLPRLQREDQCWTPIDIPRRRTNPKAVATSRRRAGPATIQSAAA